MGSTAGLCASCLVACLLVTACHSSAVPDSGPDVPESGRQARDSLDARRYFLHQLFSKYGDGGKMTFDGFEHLLQSLGLGNIIIRDHDLGAHKEGAPFKDTHDDMHEHTPGGAKDHQHSPKGHSHSTKDHHSHDIKEGVEMITLPLPKHHDKYSHSHDGHEGHSHLPKLNTTPTIRTNNTSMTGTVPPTADHHDHGFDTDHEKCLSAKEMLYAFDMTPPSALNPNSFLLLCPAIVYELDQGHCGQPHGHEPQRATLHQWLYASLAVLLISLCGLFSVAVIPIMQKWFYHTLLQFLVGLAVGSLAGDGLLHLLPHAMIEDGHQHGGFAQKTDEQLMVWRGMAALGGIFFFFIAERLLGAFTAYRRQRKEAKAAQPFARMLPVSANGLVHEDQNDVEVGEKLSHYRKNSYGLMIGAEGKEAMQMLPQEAPPSRKSSTHSNHEVGFHGRSSFSLEPDARVSFSAGDRTVTVSEHHGHGHGHSHEVPQSVSAVAWMVIMGDGLHNFCDGLAIGAAFAAGTAGGLSTTVAVFCHELPHELGDFAMLLKTGMKVKQALLYNGLSSVLCFIGMVIGLSLGRVESATSWVFAGTAGMFLYIALVDMLPELATTSADMGSNATYTLAVQVLGISIGVSVMLLIALFEPQLMEMFS